MKIGNFKIYPIERFLNLGWFPFAGKEPCDPVCNPLHYIRPTYGKIEQEKAAGYKNPCHIDHNIRDCTQTMPFFRESKHCNCCEACKDNAIQHALHDNDCRSITERDVCLIELVHPDRFSASLGRCDCSREKISKNKI